jgi:hypothetical protein
MLLCCLLGICFILLHFKQVCSCDCAGVVTGSYKVWASHHDLCCPAPQVTSRFRHIRLPTTRTQTYVYTTDTGNLQTHPLLSCAWTYKYGVVLHPIRVMMKVYWEIIREPAADRSAVQAEVPRAPRFKPVCAHSDSLCGGPYKHYKFSSLLPQ